MSATAILGAVRIRRLVAVGIVVAAVTAACTLSLSTTEQKVITLASGNNDYGGVDVGSSASQSFTFTPQGMSDDDTITMVAFNATTIGCGEFSLMKSPLPARVYYPTSGIACAFAGTTPAGTAGAPCTYTFGVTFMPTTPGMTSCEVDLTYTPTANPGMTPTVYTLELDGTGIQDIALVSNPTSISFGNVPLNSGSSSAVPLTVTNTGTVSLVVTDTKSDPSGWFSLSPAYPVPHPIAAGSADPYKVYCTPSGLGGDQTATLTFTGSGGGSGSSATTMLSCTGINTNLAINPIPVVFPTTLVGSAASPQSVTILNNGSAGTLTVSLDTTATSNGVTLPNPFTNVPIAMNGSAMATVDYSAATAHTGSLGNLVVHISTDGAGNNFNVGLNGEADPGAIATNPASVDFGPLCAGGSGTQDVTVYATASGTVTLKTADVSPSPLFAVGSGSGTLMGNHANEIKVSVTAAPTTVGDFMGTLTLDTNIPGMMSQDIALQGTALQAGVGATPNLVHFGAVMTGLISAEQQVVLTNCGTSDLTLTGASFTGTDPGEFQVISPTSFPVTVTKTLSQTFDVVMTPHSVGPKSATLVIAQDSGTTSAIFDGMGIAGSGGGNTERETYYACSTGRSTAAWPIGLALLALRRRRR